MGIADQKVLHAAENVDFDFSKPDVYVSTDQQAVLRTRHDEEIILRQAAGLLTQGDRTSDDRLLSAALVKTADARFRQLEAEREINYVARAVKHIIRATVQAALPKPDEIVKKVRARYRRWQRCIDFDRPDVAVLTVADVDWMREVLDRETVGVSIEESDWVEGTRDYCEAVLKAKLEPKV